MPEELDGHLLSCDFIYEVGNLFGFSPIGFGDDGMMDYMVRLYLYDEVELEPEVTANAHALLEYHGIKLDDDDSFTQH